MTKQELSEQLKKYHREFSDYIIGLNDADFLYSFQNEKWDAGQQLEHIIMSVSPLVKAFMLPNFVLSLAFGKANRKSKTYDELVAKYHSKLEAGGSAPSRFSPRKMEVNQKMNKQKHLLKLVAKLCKQLAGFTDEQLEIYILPHPLLGKITLREMFYFTIYHVQHHHKIAQRNLNNRP